MRSSLRKVYAWFADASGSTRLSRRWMLIGVAAGVVVMIVSPGIEAAALVIGGLLLIRLAWLLPVLATKRKWLSFRVRRELVLLVTAVWVALILGEAILRACFSPAFPDLSAMWGIGLGYQPDNLLGWYPVPNSRTTFTAQRKFSIEHNSFGFRDAEPVLDHRPRIAFLGDSFVWGYNVEAAERFTERLRSRRADWQVLNLGVCGYSTDQEYLLLQKYFQTFSPRVVFLVFCTENDDTGNQSNDCGDWYYKPYYLATNSGLRLAGVPVPVSEKVLYVRHPFLSRSCLVRLVLRAWNGVRHPPPHIARNPTTAIIQSMQQYVTSRGAVFCVGLTAENLKLAEFLNASRIPWIDLSTDLRVPKDIHWSPEGHQVVASEIEEFLSRLKL